MPEQLTQSQIDALLKKMSSGEVDVQEDTRKIREYDFKSPKKFTKEQLKAMDGLHETFSRMLASYLSGLLRTVCEIEVLQIEEQRYYEYNNALPDTALVGLVSMRPRDKRLNEATLILDLSTTVGYYIIDRVLGGPGTGYNLSRNYTEIETAILTNVFEKIAMRLQDTWRNHVDVEAALDGLETNSRLLQVLAPEDIVVIVIMDVKLGSKQDSRLDGTLSICIPAEFLEDVIDSFSLKFARPSKRQDPEKEEAKKRIILENVCESDLEIRAVFDQFPMELRDILQLQPDDVIPLGKPIDSDVLVMVDDIPWLNAKLGETKQKKAIRCTNFINNGDEGIQWETSEASS